MRRAAILMTTICALLLAMRSQGNSAEPDSPTPVTQRAIALEVYVIDLKGGNQDRHPELFSGPSDEVAELIRKLEADGQIAGMDHIRLTTLENEKATVQSGTTTPIATARSFGGRGGPPQTSYQQENFGTMLSVTAAAEGRTVAVNLQIEKSQLKQHDAPSQNEGDFVPAGSETLTLQTNLHILSGRTVLAGSLGSKGDGTSSERIVLVSARLVEAPTGEHPMDATNGKDSRQIRVFMLQRASAKDAARVIKDVLDVKRDQIRIAVDPRTNSLIVSARQKAVLDVIEAILMKVDEAEVKSSTSARKQPRESAFASAMAKYAKIRDKSQLQAELERLLHELAKSEQVVNETRQRARDAQNAYNAASDQDKPAALLRKLEADAASLKPAEHYSRIRAEFEAAQQAYSRLLMTE
jgi:type II secretory pathway component GspD/PulD (secretin)